MWPWNWASFKNTHSCLAPLQKHRFQLEHLRHPFLRAKQSHHSVFSELPRATVGRSRSQPDERLYGSLRPVPRACAWGQAGLRAWVGDLNNQSEGEPYGTPRDIKEVESPASGLNPASATSLSGRGDRLWGPSDSPHRDHRRKACWRHPSVCRFLWPPLGPSRGWGPPRGGGLQTADLGADRQPALESTEARGTHSFSLAKPSCWRLSGGKHPAVMAEMKRDGHFLRVGNQLAETGLGNKTVASCTVLVPQGLVLGNRIPLPLSSAGF